MNWAHLHLLLNHIPVIGTALGIALLTLAMLRRSKELKGVSFGILVTIALSGVPVYLTGGPARKFVRDLPGVSSEIIRRHSDAAFISTIALESTGILCLGRLLLFRKPLSVAPVWLDVVLLLAALAVEGLLVWTSFLGGEIRHTEIRSALRNHLFGLVQCAGPTCARAVRACNYWIKSNPKII